MASAPEFFHMVAENGNGVHPIASEFDLDAELMGSRTPIHGKDMQDVAKQVGDQLFAWQGGILELLARTHIREDEIGPFVRLIVRGLLQKKLKIAADARDNNTNPVYPYPLSEPPDVIESLVSLSIRRSVEGRHVSSFTQIMSFGGQALANMTKGAKKAILGD